MSNSQHRTHDEVEHLIRNAELHDELEPYFDESIGCINTREFSTPQENEFLASMLAWERAPVLPISAWFQPQLMIPHPDEFGHDDDGECRLHDTLWETIHRFFTKRIVLEFTDHLSDRALYCLIYRDILPSQEKKLEGCNTYLHWDCSDAGTNEEIWLQYYATEEDRDMWTQETGLDPAPRCAPPFPRTLPRDPL